MSFDPTHIEQLIAADAALDALRCAERAYAKTPDDPSVRSYLGYLEAAERGRLRQGLELCEEALAREPHPVCVELNTARVYLKARRKDDAVRCLRAGLERAPDHPQLVAELARLGTRRDPILAWLPRGSALNKYLGLIAARLGLR